MKHSLVQLQNGSVLKKEHLSITDDKLTYHIGTYLPQASIRKWQTKCAANDGEDIVSLLISQVARRHFVAQKPS